MAASLMHAIKRDVVPFCIGVGVGVGGDVCTRDDDTHTRDIMLREQVASLANRSNDPAQLLSSVVEMTCRRLGFLAGNALMREGVEGRFDNTHIAARCGRARLVARDDSRSRLSLQWW